MSQLPSKTRHNLLFSVVLCSQTLLFGCNRTSGSGAAKDDLRMVPKETDVVFMVNVTQARKSPLWDKFVEKFNQSKESKKNLDEVVAKCQIDPVKQIDSLFVAVPSNVDESKEFAVLLKGSFSPDKFVDCIVKIAKEKNEAVTDGEYNGVKYYSMGRPSSFMAAIPKKAVVLAGSEWIKKTIDLANGKGDSATGNAALLDTIKRTKTAHTLWWAGLVPEKVVEKMGSNPQLTPLRSLKSVSGSIDIAKGLEMHAYLDLGSDADATQLKDKATEQLGGLRNLPAVKMMGMASFIDTVKVSSQKASFVVDVNMDQKQMDDLIERVTGMAQQFGGRSRHAD